MNKRYVFLLLFLFFIASIGYSAIYYVSPAGNNINSGISTASTWKTIQFALNQANDGDIINLMSGTYTGKFTWNDGGIIGNYIVLQNYMDEVVILDGSTVGNNQSMMYIENKDYIKIEGLKFTAHDGIYQPIINLYGNCNHIEITNCEFYNTDCDESYAILCEGRGDDIKIMDNYMHDLVGDNAVGILFVGSNTGIPFTNILISNNHIQNIDPAPSEAIALNGNVDGFEISNNLVEDVNNIGIVMIGGEDWVNTNDAVNFARNGNCKKNVVINANSIYGGGFAAGVYVDGGKDIIVQNNTITGSDIGMEIGCENMGFITENIIVRNNIIYKNEKSGLGFGGYDFPATGQVKNCSFTGNTVFDNDILNTGFGQLWVQYALNCEVKNNIFYTSTNAWVVNAEIIDKTFDNIFDYNLYYYPGGAIDTKYLYGGDYIVGYDLYKSLTGMDVNSIFIDPLFVDIIIPEYDFHLQMLSPCINAGNPAYDDAGIEITDIDMDGSTRVIGTEIDMGSDELENLSLAISPIVVSATCYGTCNGSLTILGINGCLPYEIEYKQPGGGWIDYYDVLTGVCAGTYKLKITDGCGNIVSGNTIISQDPLLNINVTSIVNETFVGASNGKIVVSASGGFGSKQFSIDGGATWQTNKKFAGLTAGTYSILVKDLHNCIQTVSAIVSVGMKMGESNEFNIFPNPTTDKFTIMCYHLFEHPISIKIFNVNGMMVYSQNEIAETDEIVIDSDLPSSMYFIGLKTGEIMEFQKLVIQ